MKPDSVTDFILDILLSCALLVLQMLCIWFPEEFADATGPLFIATEASPPILVSFMGWVLLAGPGVLVVAVRVWAYFIMTDLLILLSFVVLSIGVTVYLAMRGMKGLRQQKMVGDRSGNCVTGKSAVCLARVYLFYAGLSLVCSAFFLFLLAVRMIHQLL
jgi:hypothetical protein